MKTARVYFVILAVLVAFVLSAVSVAHTRGDQEQTQKTESPVKPTVLIRVPNNSNVTNPSPTASATFADAAAKNTVFRDQLTWTFGGKQQHGWYLYDLLLRETLRTPSSTPTSDFAAALSTWQETRGLDANGILDEDSFMALVAYWQSNRLKERTPASADQLVTAPASEFYDPERDAELRQVERNTYEAYKRMLTAAIADPTLKLDHVQRDQLAPTEQFFKIISAHRSREYQEKLRRESPNAGSAGLAVNSPHFTGRALDIYVGGDPVDTRDSNRAIQVNTPVYRWLVQNAERFGFRPYFYEPWHWEYVK
ncbi:MAG TPA: D-alanyl-D-alanine carboxypeptidase family protein [Pyrinomonadaceae bacterium]|nr:D-alanyl-D-alanine carboxypeptidase family protein [Pyrinomonadaceae bacterium]